MSTDIFLPKIGFSMGEGQIQDWFATDGDAVTEGQPLFTLESDKSVTEIESPASGVLRILAATGETIEVGTLIGRID
ncbi:MAG: biotin/lipoyl-binding protein [Sphingomonadales bacterium]|jgi:pyruvate/2-oxoglutarate dehydrogenase complex dihydrolipoamide acyltransferase (E2) component|nr:biotin/lipoyl-binding protein [Sphingomonadales bacterium]